MTTPKKTPAWTGAKSAAHVPVPVFKSQKQPPGHSLDSRHPASAVSSSDGTSSADASSSAQSAPSAAATLQHPSQGSGPSKISVSRSATRFQALSSALVGETVTYKHASSPHASTGIVQKPLSTALHIVNTDSLQPESVPLESVSTIRTGPITFAQIARGFRTDADISRGAQRSDRDLVAWNPGDSEAPALDTLQGSVGAWDQFAANEQLTGVSSNYSHDLYTTAIDTSAPDFSRKQQEAAQIEKEILANPTSGNIHMAEERGEIQDIDEEALYGQVNAADLAPKSGTASKTETRDSPRPESNVIPTESKDISSQPSEPPKRTPIPSVRVNDSKGLQIETERVPRASSALSPSLATIASVAARRETSRTKDKPKPSYGALYDKLQVNSLRVLKEAPSATVPMKWPYKGPSFTAPISHFISKIEAEMPDTDRARAPRDRSSRDNRPKPQAGPPYLYPFVPMYPDYYAQMYAPYARNK